MSQFLNGIDRKVAIINLDPANDGTPYVYRNFKNLYISKLNHQLFCSYTPDIDIGELITLKKAMNEHQLGPNGGLIYCLEYLDANVDWLVEKLKSVSGVLFQFEDTKN